jgi:hypothetical protein
MAQEAKGNLTPSFRALVVFSLVGLTLCGRNSIRLLSGSFVDWFWFTLNHIYDLGGLCKSQAAFAFYSSKVEYVFSKPNSIRKIFRKIVCNRGLLSYFAGQ